MTTTRSTSHVTWMLAVGLGAAFVGACKKEGAPETSAPADAGGAFGESAADAAAEEPGEHEDLDGLEAEVDRLASELTEAGLGPDGFQAAATAEETAARCDRVCRLAEATCDLEGRICALADEHTGEDRYASACARAGDQCDRATEACRACSG